MSKFTITKTTEGRTWLVWRMSNVMGTTDTLTIELVDDDLSDLASCVQAALSGVKAETRTCRCNLRTYGVDRYPVCKAEFKQDEDEDAAADFCDNTIRMLGDAPVPCGHCKACHS